MDILTTLVPWLANVGLDFKKKLRGQADNLPCIEAMLATWAMHADILKGMMEAANEVRCCLAHRPHNTLHQPFKSTTIRLAIHNCHVTRNRFNLVDLMNLLDLWDMETVYSLMGLVGAAYLEKSGRSTD